MGWRPGEGLGKEKNGSLQPLLLEVKLDKRGLVADEEVRLPKSHWIIWFAYSTHSIHIFQTPKGQRQKAQPAKKKASSIQMAKQNMESKHPVSLLGELCAKRKYGAPFYEVVMEDGPFHHRKFLFKVNDRKKQMHLYPVILGNNSLSSCHDPSRSPWMDKSISQQYQAWIRKRPKQWPHGTLWSKWVFCPGHQRRNKERKLRNMYHRSNDSSYRLTLILFAIIQMAAFQCNSLQSFYSFHFNAYRYLMTITYLLGTT